MRKPTDKQIKYAYAIADMLGLKRPTGDFSDFHTFIATNNETYKKLFRKERMTDEKKYSYLPDGLICLDFGKQVADFVNENLHNKTGLYAFLSSGKVVYIGKSYNLADRIPTSYGARRKQAKIDNIMFYVTDNKTDADLLEIMLISEYAPILNVDCNNGEKTARFFSGLNILTDFTEIPLGKVESQSA